MNIEDWWPFYSRICEDFSFDPGADFLSSLKLSSILGSKSEKSKLHILKEKEVNIFGNSRNMSEFIDSSPRAVDIVADSALDTYFEKRKCPEIIVTDLDGNMEKITECGKSGTVLVIHSHGDNIQRIRSLEVASIGNIVGTTQNIPLWNLFNYGGFTDGDRAAFIADTLGAIRINLIGFDFMSVNKNKDSDPEVKLRKLKWAKKLLFHLAESRGSVLTEGGIIQI